MLTPKVISSNVHQCNIKYIKITKTMRILSDCLLTAFSKIKDEVKKEFSGNKFHQKYDYATCLYGF